MTAAYPYVVGTGLIVSGFGLVSGWGVGQGSPNKNTFVSGSWTRPKKEKQNQNSVFDHSCFWSAMFGNFLRILRSPGGTRHKIRVDFRNRILKSGARQNAGCGRVTDRFLAVAQICGDLLWPVHSTLRVQEPKNRLFGMPSRRSTTNNHNWYAAARHSTKFSMHNIRDHLSLMTMWT